MGYKKPIPVDKKDIKVGNQYCTCTYGGTIKVTVIKIFDGTNSVLVIVKSMHKLKKWKILSDTYTK